METTKEKMATSKTTWLGLFLILVSTGIFLMPEFDLFHVRRESYFGIFFFNYAASVVYLVLLILQGLIRFKWAIFRNHIEKTMLLLVLFLISAFSLNREFSVFERSSDWLCITLVLQCVAIMALVFREYLPRFILFLLYITMGTGLILDLYFSVYLFPMYAIGVIGSFFIGISLHVFVPLLFVIFISIYMIRRYKDDARSLIPFAAGMIVPVIITIGFLIQWQSTKNQVNYILNESLISETTLPNWVKLSQQMERNSIAEKMLKTDLVYSTHDVDKFWFWDIPSRSFDEVKKHDPLVMTASLVLGKPDLSETEKIKILESMYDSRHQAQERLWSGDKLETGNVISNIRIYPEYRIAYTEKILSIRNNNDRRSWRNRQEAIYTFHLPEGGVVTSLSLWINGKEEKGILTTKSKADSAYKTIVGVERRDPSLIHWQEGNTVTVRVFPCTPDENRKFKIGITAPLRKEGKKLVYENIYFDGPSGSNATESIHTVFTSQPSEIFFPFKFSETGKGYVVNKNYKPYWEICFTPGSLSEKAFTFNNKSYTIEDYWPSFEEFNPEIIYLDINNSWTRTEFMELWKQVKTKKVYACNDSLIRLDDENAEKVFAELSRNNFSLFPVHQIKCPDKALVISKSSAVSPNLQDLRESTFGDNLSAYLKLARQVRWFNIGNELSPYVRTLKELRVFIYSQGSNADLYALLRDGKYIRNQETDTSVVIDNAQIQITETNETLTGNAPDHLLRLFAYNHIMKKISGSYFDPDHSDTSIIAEAQKAYVVSPVSSLIVLETKKDYEDFGIKDSENSLKNASMKSSGAVPEPHEWMLIILAAVVAGYLVLRNYNDRKFQIRW